MDTKIKIVKINKKITIRMMISNKIFLFVSIIKKNFIAGILLSISILTLSPLSKKTNFSQLILNNQDPDPKVEGNPYNLDIIVIPKKNPKGKVR